MQMRIVIEGSMQGSEPALLLKMQQGGCIVIAFAFPMRPKGLHCYFNAAQRPAFSLHLRIPNASTLLACLRASLCGVDLLGHRQVHR